MTAAPAPAMSAAHHARHAPSAERAAKPAPAAPRRRGATELVAVFDSEGFELVRRPVRVVTREDEMPDELPGQ